MRRTLARLSLAVAATAFAVVGTVPAQGIVNGSNAATNPGAVSLWTDNPNRNRCTGTLVDDEQGGTGTRWVLTAAHCVYAFTEDDPPAGRVTARIGSTDNTVGYTAIKVVPGQFWWNPAFDPNTLGYDVMLMLLEQETPANVPVMKWRKPSLPVGAVTQAYGWGWTCEASCRTPLLQTMTAERLPDTNCETFLDPSQVCFEHAGGGYTMTCQGDSGGPMKSPDFDGSPILRWSVVGEGDSNWNACLQDAEGDPGRGLAIDIGRADIQAWMDDVMGIGGSLAAAAGVAPTPPAPTARVLTLLN